MSESEAVERNAKVRAEALRRHRAIAEGPSHVAADGIKEAAVAGVEFGRRVATGEVLGSAEQMNWGGMMTGFPAMSPSGVPEQPLGRPLVPDAPQPGSSGMSGVEAIRNHTDSLGWGK